MPPRLYVQYGARAAVPPVIATNVQIFGFFLQADESKLNALCQKVFQAPTVNATGTPAVTCEALDQYVLLTFATLPSVQDVVGGPSTSEKEVVIFVPVKISVGANPTFHALFSPYIILDNPMTITCGRELWGYPKSYGKATTHYSVATQPSFNVQAFGGKAGNPTFGLFPLINITSQGYLSDPVSWGSLVQPLTSDFATLATNLTNGVGVQQIFLKQFQDVDGIHSCVQQITVANYTVAPTFPTPVPLLLGYDFKVTIHELESHPITGELGLASQVAKGGFVLTENFVLAQATVLWAPP